MNELRNRVAVITGAGSGIGRALASACAGQGMHLVLADVDDAGLAATAELLAGAQRQIITRRCDVSDASEVEALADATYARFGATHLLFNNAGVSPAGPMWLSTQADWQWVWGVNVMGVVHGVQSFVPRMLEGGQPGRVINTASVAGLIPAAGFSAYVASKHAVIGASECIQLELQAAGAQVGVSVLCPGYVTTAIGRSERHRPGELAAANPKSAAYMGKMDEALQTAGLSPDAVAQTTLEAVRAGRFYILSHPEYLQQVRGHADDIVAGRDPAPFRPIFRGGGGAGGAG